MAYASIRIVKKEYGRIIPASSFDEFVGEVLVICQASAMD